MSNSLVDAITAPVTGEDADSTMVAIVWLLIGIIIDRKLLRE